MEGPPGAAADGWADEGRHRPDRSLPGWVESWAFDAVAPDASLGLFVRVALHPALGRCSYWAGVVGEGRPYLLVRDDDLDLPPAAVGLEVRGSLWADTRCEAPWSHWTLGLESWAVAFEPGDELDAWGQERGGRDGLALDLAFEDEAGSGGPCPLDVGWWRAGRLWGEALVGTGDRHERIEPQGWPAVRRHAWGPVRSSGWSWWWPPGAAAPTYLEHAAALPRTVDGLPSTDGRLAAVRWAPVLATEPAGWRVGRAVGLGSGGEVGWLESWVAP